MIHEASQRTYGTPRVLGQLQHRNRRVGRKRVARIMAECGLVGVHGRKEWRRVKRSSSAPGPDLIGRDFTAEASNQRWVADITEFGCRDGKLYLAGILDLHDRGLAGWSMSNRATADIVVNALVMALARRQPVGEVIHHADRGGQYVSGDLALTMTDHHVTASFGRTGVCWDCDDRGCRGVHRSGRLSTEAGPRGLTPAMTDHGVHALTCRPPGPVSCCLAGRSGSDLIGA